MGIKARTAKAATTEKAGGGRKAGAPKTRASSAAAKGAAKTKAPGRRAGSRARSGMKSADEYVSGLEGWRAEAVSALRQIVREAAPEAEEAIKWARPVYSHNGPLCYIRAFNDHVNLGFWRGTELEAAEGILTGEGQKMAHISFSSREDINPDVITPLLQQAIELNQTLGDPTTKKAGKKKATTKKATTKKATTKKATTKKATTKKATTKKATTKK
jgi:hypothetical protein